MTVLFIHGIDQQEFTAAQLLTTWTNNIEDVAPGLLLNTPVQMAYYATILAEFSAGSFSSATTMGSDLSNANSAELNFCYDVLDEIAIANGLDLSTVQQVMSGETDDIVPMGSSLLRSIVRIAAALEKKAPQRTEIVLRLLKQAYIYLTVMSARRAVDSAVRPMIEQNPQILITHSLGTVVAFNILQQLEKEMASIDIPLFITLGSPLGLEAFKARLEGPRKKPGNVQRWVNFFDTSDIVTLGKNLDIDTFADGIENDGTVNNKSKNAHSIAGYLIHQNLIDLLRNTINKEFNLRG